MRHIIGIYEMSNFDKLDNANLNRRLFALALDPRAGRTLQTQLLDALRDMIQSTPSAARTRLPASRALAAELSVSRTTVQAVYDQLISEGYVVARRGSGTFVADDIAHLGPPSGDATTARPAIAAWRPFQIGLPDLSLLPHAQWARQLERAWRSPGPDLLGRADPLGWWPLREAIANHLAVWRQLDCAPEQVVVTSGAWESFDIIFGGLLQSGEPVAVEDPCWPKVHELLAVAGADARPVRIDRDGLDASRIPAGTRAAVVTPSRHYPTGRSLPMARRVALLDWAARDEGLIVEDDYDSEFRYQGRPLPSLSGLDGLQHTIYLGSFSKLISPALRIGYLVAPTGLVGRIRRYLDRVGTRASLVPQPALAAFMESGAFAVHLRRMRRIYARRQTHLVQALAPARDFLEVEPDAAGMHLCLPLRSRRRGRMSDREIAAHARDIGVDVGALSAHSVLPETMEALLLGYAAFDEEALSEAADRLIALLRTAL